MSWIKTKIRNWLGITVIDNAVEQIQEVTGIPYVKWVRYGEYTGESGMWRDRIINLEREVFNKPTTNKEDKDAKKD